MVKFGSLAVLLAAGAAHALEPCAEVTDLFKKSQASNSTLSLPGEPVHRCLLSMPMDVSKSVQLITEYRKYCQFQSTLENLKNPPSDYPNPPTDILGGLDRIQNKAKHNKYGSQFEFDTELLELIRSANDGHFQMKPCSTTVFTFTHPEPLVSVSEDGLKLPQVYTYNDAKLLSQGVSVSPVVSINGTDATKYIEKFSFGEKPQDPDARYNLMFPSLSRSDAPKGLWMKTPLWPGASSAFRFKNGTSKKVETLATTKYSTLNVKNGTDMLHRACLLTRISVAKRSEMESSPEIPTGYPKQVLQNGTDNLLGYLPTDQGLRDTAVLVIPTFSYMAVDAQPVIKSFLRNATASGKKNLLIDLSGNGGGDIFSGFGLFAELFPGKNINLGARFRAHESADFIGRAFASLNRSAALETAVEDENPYPYQIQVSRDQKHGFESWSDLFGPYKVDGANLSDISAIYNYTAFSSEEIPINGYGSVPLNPKKAAFAPENITLITDGYCASTCTTFASLMKQQGVRSIAFGGRPRNEPMQAMGGVKGALTLATAAIHGLMTSAQKIISNAAKTESPILSNAEWKRFNETIPDQSLDFSMSLAGSSVNLRNAYGAGDDKTPLQFVYEAAECRLFYTVENYLHQKSVWKAAAKAMFGGGKCVDGSTKGKGSLHA